MKFTRKRRSLAYALLFGSFTANISAQICVPLNPSCCQVVLNDDLTLTTSDSAPGSLAISSQGCLSLVSGGAINSYKIDPMTCALTGPSINSSFDVSGSIAYSPSGACLVAKHFYHFIDEFLQR